MEIRCIIQNLIVLMMLDIIRSNEINEVCDAKEGSGAMDCDEQCCQQSICDQENFDKNPDQNPDKEIVEISCCDDKIRNDESTVFFTKLDPTPGKYCSKCKKCEAEKQSTKRSIPLFFTTTETTEISKLSSLTSEKQATTTLGNIPRIKADDLSTLMEDSASTKRVSTPRTLEGDGNTMKKAPVSKMASGIYIVIPVALLAIIGIFIYLAYLHRKREAKRMSMRQSEILGLMVEKRHSDQSTEDTAEEKRPVRMKHILEDKIRPVKEEYDELNDLDRRKNWSRFSKAIGEIHNTITSSDGQIKCLNRNQGVLPYDHNRIKLMNPIDGRDYINASQILPSNYSEPDRLSLLPKLSFIAAQGPMEETTSHFLQMIYEQRVDIVVMLTQLEEKEGSQKRMSRNSKCERYWPTNEGLVEVFGSFHVENSNEARVFDSNNQIIPDAIKRKLGIRHPFQDQGKLHSFDHFQFTGWPENGTPNTAKPIIDLIKEIFEMISKKKEDSKILVHSSLGVGRTGTFIALLELLDILDAKLSEFKQLNRIMPQQTSRIIDETSLDIFNTVFRLRKQRCEMVQTFPQYEFIHKCIVAYSTSIENETERKENSKLRVNQVTDRKDCDSIFMDLSGGLKT